MELQESNMEEDENSIEVPNLNPMAFYPGFPHFAEKIFLKMDKDNLKNLRLLSKSWMEYIDDKNGLLELRTSEGGHGSLILFNESQVWISNRYVIRLLFLASKHAIISLF